MSCTRAPGLVSMLRTVLLAPPDTNLLTGQKSNACVKIQIILDVQPRRFLIIKLVHSLPGDGYKYTDSVM